MRGVIRGSSSVDYLFQGIHLVATDLDGTLLRDDGGISPYTRDMLGLVQDAGLLLMLVTARSPRTLRVKAQQIGVTGLAICCNGALVYNLTADAIVEHRALSAAIARRIILALRAACAC